MVDCSVAGDFLSPDMFGFSLGENECMQVSGQRTSVWIAKTRSCKDSGLQGCASFRSVFADHDVIIMGYTVSRGPQRLC